MKMKQLILIILFAFTFSSFAQVLNLRHIKTNSSKPPVTVTAVQVFDNNNEPVTGLDASGFRISIDGMLPDTLQVATYEKSGIGLDIMLCLDVSGSMTGAPLETMKKSVLEFIEDMRSIDRLAIYSYADDAVLVTDFSGEKEYLKRKVNGLTAGGTSTSLYYGIHKGIEHLKKSPEDKGKIVIVIGDGHNESPAHSFAEDDIIGSANQDGIPVFSLGYTRGNRAHFQSLEKISGKTGGNFYDSPTDEELRTQYEKLYKQVLNIYLLTYKAYGKEGAGVKHDGAVTVTYNGKQDSKNFTLIASLTPKKTDDSSGGISTTMILIIIGSLIVIAVVLFLISRKITQKREEEQAAKREELKRKHEEEMNRLREEKAALEKNAREKANQQAQTMVGSPEEMGAILGGQDDKTFIMRPSGNANILRMAVQVGPLTGKSFNIRQSGAKIGRVDGNTVVLPEQTVSAQHAEIYYKGGAFYIKNLSASNGTYVNGNLITDIMLKHGDYFKIGKNEGQFSIY